METYGSVSCHCGRPLHYGNKKTQAVIEEMVNELGSHIIVSDMGGRKWLVQRHYIALHGLKAWELHKLGFQEVTP